MKGVLLEASHLSDYFIHDPTDDTSSSQAQERSSMFVYLSPRSDEPVS